MSASGVGSTPYGAIVSFRPLGLLTIAASVARAAHDTASTGIALA